MTEPRRGDDEEAGLPGVLATVEFAGSKLHGDVATYYWRVSVGCRRCQLKVISFSIGLFCSSNGMNWSRHLGKHLG